VGERVANLMFIVECPLCQEKREISYQFNIRIQNNLNTEHCKVCARLIRARELLKKTNNIKKTSLIKCSVCNLNIKVTPSYKYDMTIRHKEDYVCIDCRIAKQIALREINVNNDKVIKKEEEVNEISLFDCILKKRDDLINSNRCSLGRKCIHYLDCLDAVINLGWQGFSAIGVGYPKKDIFAELSK